MYKPQFFKGLLYIVTSDVASVKTSPVMAEALYSSSRTFSNQQFFFIALKWEFFFRVFSTWTFSKLLSPKFSKYPNPGCPIIVFIKPNQMIQGISLSPQTDIAVLVQSTVQFECLSILWFALNQTSFQITIWTAKFHFLNWVLVLYFWNEIYKQRKYFTLFFFKKRRGGSGIVNMCMLSFMWNLYYNKSLIRITDLEAS